MGFQAEKTLVREMYQTIDGANAGDDLAGAMAPYYAPNLLWRGYCPFYEQNGINAVVDTFWTPLRHSLKHMQRRQDIFFAGENVTDHGGTWIVSMGHLMGLFDEPWLGIAPTGKMAFLRYCEFNRVDDGKITETAMYFDIPHLMMQAGLNPFPPQTAAHLVQPGPMTHDGLLFDDAAPDQGRATLDVIHRMIGDLGTWQNDLSLEDELRQTWHEDMIWWGPAGVGATYTIPRYAQQHSGPFRAAFAERSKTNHIARLAEGNFGGFFGWPNFTARHVGGFMGMPATDTRGEFRVIDIYRRDGDKLAENWVFIDIPHFWKTQGVDILARMQTVPRT